MHRAHPFDFVQGVPTIRRAIINIKENNDHRGKKGDKELLVEGYGLQKVMTTQGTLGSCSLPPSTDASRRYCWRANNLQPRHRDRAGPWN